MGLFQRITSVIGRALKAIPFPGFGGSGMSSGWGWGGWPWSWYPNTNINFAREVGDLTRSSLIMAVVNWVGTALPEAPIEVLERKEGKLWEPIPDHPMVKLLERPNPYYSGELLWKAWAVSWIINGNAYFLKLRNTFGEVIQLWYEPHDTIRPRWPEDGSEFISFYEVERDGRWIRVETQDVIHFRCGIDTEHPSNGRLGLSPVGSLLREIFTDNERARYSALILRNGGVVPVLLTPETGISAKGINAEEIKREWQARTTGDHIGEPIVLSGPMKAQALGISPDKLLVEKASEIPEARVCAVIGIPAGVVGFKIGMDQTKVGATMKELREQAWESYVIPTQRIAAGELKAQLLIEWGDTDGLKVRHDLSEVRVLQDDRNELYEREALAWEKGVKRRSEARSALGLDTTPEDDVYFVEPMPVAPVGQNKPDDKPSDDEPQRVNEGSAEQ